jgi:hypothetical protein
MNKVGLVQNDDDYYVPDIYACYEGSHRPGSTAWTQAFHNVRDTRPGPPIRFVGVWDTVGSLGAPGFLGQVFNPNKYCYHDIELNPHIQSAYQALAIDERRKAFAPNPWQRPDSWTGNLEQAWFAAVHSDVGGGYSPDGLANEALHWMVEKAAAEGLEFDEKYLAYFRPCFNGVRHESMSMMYKLLGEYERPLGTRPADGETVHQSAIDRLNIATCNYDPPNLRTYLRRVQPARVSDTSRISRGAPC